MWNSEFIVTTGRLALSAAATTSVAWIASPVHSSTTSELSISSASELVSSSGRGKPVQPSTGRRVSTREAVKPSCRSSAMMK